MHPVLRLKEAHRSGGKKLRAPLKERKIQAARRSCCAFDRRRELLVIAGKHSARGEEERGPALRLERLRRLINDDEIKGETRRQLAQQCRAAVRAEHHILAANHFISKALLATAQLCTEPPHFNI